MSSNTVPVDLLWCFYCRWYNFSFLCTFVQGEGYNEVKCNHRVAVICRIVQSVIIIWPFSHVVVRFPYPGNRLYGFHRLTSRQGVGVYTCKGTFCIRNRTKRSREEPYMCRSGIRYARLHTPTLYTSAFMTRVAFDEKLAKHQDGRRLQQRRQNNKTYYRRQKGLVNLRNRRDIWSVVGSRATSKIKK